MLYNPMAYTSLNDSDSNLSHHARQQLSSIGEIFWAHNMQGEFAAVYLHKHFDIKPEERLVEELQHSAITITPQRNYGELAPYLWRSSSLGWLPVEFVACNEWSESAFKQAKTFEDARIFQQDLYNFLLKANLEDQIGVISRHRESVFSRAKIVDPCLVETSFKFERRLELKVEVGSELNRDELIETVWHFPVRGSDGSVAVACRNTCRPNGGNHH